MLPSSCEMYCLINLCELLWIFCYPNRKICPHNPVLKYSSYSSRVNLQAWTFADSEFVYCVVLSQLLLFFALYKPTTLSGYYAKWPQEECTPAWNSRVLNILNGRPRKDLSSKTKVWPCLRRLRPECNQTGLTIRSMGDVTDKEGKRIYRLYIYKIELRIKKNFDMMYGAKNTAERIKSAFLFARSYESFFFRHYICLKLLWTSMSWLVRFRGRPPRFLCMLGSRCRVL
jgi:hypothetical protein